MHNPARINRVVLGVVVPFAFAATACSDNPTSPESLEGPCDPTVVIRHTPVATPPPLSAVREALIHAAEVMSKGLEDSAQSRTLLRELTALHPPVGPVNAEVTCTLLVRAGEALDAVPDDPATRPDRDGIQLILDLAAGALLAQHTIAPPNSRIDP